MILYSKYNDDYFCVIKNFFFKFLFMILSKGIFFGGSKRLKDIFCIYGILKDINIIKILLFTYKYNYVRK